MDPQRLFHAVVTLYENHRATVLGEQLGISPFAVRVLDIVTCLPGSRIEDVENLLTATRAKVVSTVFELSGKGLLAYIDPSFVHEDMRLYAQHELPSLPEATHQGVVSAEDVMPDDLATALETYQRKLLDQIAQWTAGSDERASEVMLQALAKAESGDHPASGVRPCRFQKGSTDHDHERFAFPVSCLHGGL
ncbi:hypothetical protein ACV229_26280 [Burkholderia sp. MR1-5-21]